MRLSSIVSLILGAIAIVIGVMLCRQAESDAIADGYDLHQNIFDENGNIEKEYSFSSADDFNVTKIEVELEGVDVHIIGGAEKSKVVIKNLFGGTYSCNVSNKVITITNKMDVSTLFDALQYVEFNGIRNIFDPDNFKKRIPEIFIYVNTDEDDIKQISLNVTDCKNTTISGIESSLDLLVKTNNSTVHFADFATDSSIRCESVNSDINFTNVDFLSADITGDVKSFKFDSELIKLYTIIAQTPGKLVANGVEYADVFAHNDNVKDYPTININFTSGDIELNFMG